MSIQRSMQRPMPSGASLDWTVWLAGAVALVLAVFLAVLLCGDLGSALGSLFADNPGFAPYFTT